MSPRASAKAAAATRSSILDEAVEIASTTGLEPLSIGRLAEQLEMSKAGVVGPFGSKEQLQLAAIERASETFRREVWEPAADAEPGLPRLWGICEAWLSYFERDVFPGGCFLTQASAEFDGRPGPVKDAIAGGLVRWESVLAGEAATAIGRGELPAGTDPGQIAFELNSIAQGVNQARQLRADPEAIARGRRAMRRVLGLAEA
jgi:AcrR family transcriptional regulator